MDILYFETDEFKDLTALASLIKFDKINIYGDTSYFSYDDIADNELVSDLCCDDEIPANHFDSSHELSVINDYIYFVNNKKTVNEILFSYERNNKLKDIDTFSKLIIFLKEVFNKIENFEYCFYFLSTMYIENGETTLDIFLGVIYEDEIKDYIDDFYKDKFDSINMKHSNDFFYKNKENTLLLDNDELLRDDYIQKYIYNVREINKFINSTNLNIEFLDYILNQNLYRFEKISNKNSKIVCFNEITDLLYIVMLFFEKNEYKGLSKNSDLFLSYSDTNILSDFYNV